MIKAAFFDIDGTLLSQRTRRVPESARRALWELRERGVKVVIATGRHPIELAAAGLDGLPIDGWAAANGQMCLDERRRLFAGNAIPRQGMEALVKLFERQELLLWFFGVDESFVNRGDENLEALTLAVTGVLPEVRPYQGEEVYQAVAFVSVEDEPALAAQLPGCRLQRWGSGGVDIIAADGGKVAGMQAFLDRFGIAREECMAFGDQHNDLDMLRHAGIGVAMGNAAPEVREAADYVTADVDADGLARALEHFAVIGGGTRASHG